MNTYKLFTSFSPGHFDEDQVLPDGDGHVAALVHGRLPQVHQQRVPVLTHGPHLHRRRAHHAEELQLGLSAPALCLDGHTQHTTHSPLQMN